MLLGQGPAIPGHKTYAGRVDPSPAGGRRCPIGRMRVDQKNIAIQATLTSPIGHPLPSMGEGYLIDPQFLKRESLSQGPTMVLVNTIIKKRTNTRVIFFSNDNCK